jgi:6-bladed beta-propeller
MKLQVLFVCSTLSFLSGVGGVRDELTPDASIAADTLGASIALRIGEFDGPEEYLFGDITSVAVDPRGLIYVADRIGSSVRAFLPSGEFAGWVGREGDGPGEFQWPNDILATEDGRVIIRDGSRITSLVRSSASEFPDSVVATWRLPGYSNSDSRRARLIDATYNYPSYSFRRGEPPRFNYWLFGPEGFLGDTVWVPQLRHLTGNRTAFYMISQGTGRMVYGLSTAPFGPRASWDMTSRGTLITSDGAENVLVEYSSDSEVLRRLEGPPSPRRAVPAGERADTLAAVRLRLDSIPVKLDEVHNLAPEVISGETPEFLPEVVSVHSGSGDRYWVQRWPIEGHGSSRFYDVIEENGEFVTSVTIPSPFLLDPPPFFGMNTVVGVVRDDLTDVQSVVVAKLPSLGTAGGQR